MELKLNLVDDFDVIQIAFNRTLWNWNLITETVSADLFSFNRTLWNWNTGSPTGGRVLLPFNRTLWNWNVVSTDIGISFLGLLIVPYGIETEYGMVDPVSAVTFNRTLWNWNKDVSLTRTPLRRF